MMTIFANTMEPRIVKSLPLLLLLLLTLSTAPLLAASPQASEDDADIDRIRTMLTHIIPGAQPDAIAPAPLPDFYEVSYGAEVFYVHRDGRYLLQGDLYDLENSANLTENRRSTARHKLIAAIADDTKIIFKGEKTRYIVDVYTDVDCTFCRKLHREISDYTDLGIEIRYLSYPRSGKDTSSYYKAISVWCADDRKQALTAAKQGKRLEKRSCPNPVDEHMHVADELGITGTPTLILADGSVIPGYVPAPQLLQMLEQRLGK